MDYEEDLPLSEEQLKDLDDGVRVPPGWYVADVENLTEDDYQHPNLFFHLKILAPARYEGQKVRERLWNPKNSDDHASATHAMNRRGVFAKRLGLIARGVDTSRTRVKWQLAVGKRVVVKLVFGKPNAQGKTYLQVDWGEIYPLDHPKLPDEARKLLAGQADACASIPPPSIPEAVDYGSL